MQFKGKKYLPYYRAGKLIATVLTRSLMLHILSFYLVPVWKAGTTVPVLEENWRTYVLRRISVLYPE